MINALNVLWDVAHQTKEFKAVDTSLLKPAQLAIEKGIDCILKTQLKVKGQLTAWCSQYNKKTLQPEKARAFELASLSSSESVGIVSFLMKIPQPPPAIQTAVNSAVSWLVKSMITGYKYVDVVDEKQPSGKDRVLVPESGSVVWARFYDLETGKPFFTGRDGIKKWNVAEIENERRTGYAWYGTWPQKILDKEYPEWLRKNGLKDAAKN
jgi:PelA/Pel-15E family pectate lyase